jgi:hypothetical protein
MSNPDKEDLIMVDDPWFERGMPIRSFPVTLRVGQGLWRGGEKVATVKTACVIRNATDLLEYIGAQKPQSEPIDHKADIRVEVGPDGAVYMAFFSESGAMAILDMESVALARCEWDGDSGLALLKWVRDRQRAAKKA